MRLLYVLLPGLVVFITTACPSEEQVRKDLLLEVTLDAGEEAVIPADVVPDMLLPDGIADLPDEVIPDVVQDLIPDLVADGTMEVEVPGPFCGDGECASGEDCKSCAEDCGDCTTCGNGICEAGKPVEDPEGCPEDCGPCGDGVCGM